MIQIKVKGDYKDTAKLLKVLSSKDFDQLLNDYGKRGVQELALATPVDSGLTASSWYYEIVKDLRSPSASIVWKNSNVSDNVLIAIILQYGHGTRNGGYVQGRDYINPALAPVFDEFANELWEEVTR